MKAMALMGIREMRMVDVPEPRIENDTDVLLAVGAVGVCGSDVHYYTTGRIGSQVVQYPYRVGHEFAGTVLECGAAVTRVEPGNRVAVDPAMFCGQCDQCRAGRLHTCRRLRFLGCPGQAEGCLTERIVMPESCCYKVGDGTSMERAALAEPFSIGVYAARMSVPLKGSRIAILGCGPIGLSVLVAAVEQGAKEIRATDKIPGRLAAATRGGATWTGNPDKQDVVADILRGEDPSMDVVFECCGQQEALDQAVELLKPGGTLMLVGIPEVDRVSFGIDSLRRKELCIQNVRRQNECMQPALDLVESGRVDVDFMITHRFAFEDAKASFDLVADYGDGVVKAMIEMD
ncbi:MAG: alcohol dehydrogenase catalytic domain-containing protein [Lentisphaerae bacterium]|nr:alcohol dehydrogenase catalytic domain-containing protein [Lentisphaerota bacterium]